MLLNQIRIEGNVGLHFTFNNKVRCLGFDHGCCTFYFNSQRMCCAAEVREGEHGDPWLEIKLLGFLSGQNCGLCQLFSCWLNGDCGVGEEGRFLLGDHHVHAVDFGESFPLADNFQSRADRLRVMMIDTREQRIRITFKDHHRTKVVAALAHDALCFSLGDPFTLTHGVKFFGVIFDHFTLALIDYDDPAQVDVCSGCIGFDFVFVAEQDWFGNSFVNQNLGRTKNLLFFTFGEDNALRAGLGLVNQGAHDLLGMPLHRFQALLVLVHVFDRAAGNA